MGRHFQSGHLEQTGKVRENHTKYWKTEGISNKCYLSFLVICKLTVYYFIKNKQKISKITGKWEKNIAKDGKSQEILSVRKSGNLIVFQSTAYQCVILQIHCWWSWRSKVVK